MNIFAIGDPHLSLDGSKPMDIFGEDWNAHPEKMACHWRELVTDQDWVLLPGDISWAISLQDAIQDLTFLDGLPGQKLMIRGNHDYWWTTLTKMRATLPASIHVLQNDALLIHQNLIICGTRGWNIPGSRDFKEEDRRIYERELHRLKLSLEDAARQSKHADSVEIWVMIHYPPLLENLQSEFIDLMKSYHVKKCLYGHLHGSGIQLGKTGFLEGIEFHLVSCDAIGFAPKLIASL